MKYLGSKSLVIVGMTLITILILGVDSALGVTTISNTLISGVTAFISNAADPADAGILRLGNTETICWEASPTGTDTCLTYDSNEMLQTSFGGTFYDIPMVLNRDHAQVNVASSTTETTIYSFSVPANIMGSNRCLTLILMGDVLANVATTDTLTYRLKFGGTTVFQDSTDHALSATRKPIYLQWTHCNDDATNAQLGQGFIAEAISAATTGIGDFETDEQEVVSSFQSAAGAIDTTLAQTISVTVQWDVSNASDDFEKEMAILLLY